MLDERFKRHIGIFNFNQMDRIKQKKVAVAGLGLGSSILANLSRIGFENFNIADPDIYERSNINRQHCAKESTLGQKKDAAAKAEVLDINPNCKVTTFPKGVIGENISNFLDGVEYIVDTVDVYALPEKLLLHNTAHKLNIPIISCATLGFTGTVVYFDRSTPSFAQLTGITDFDSKRDGLIKFLMFMAPQIPEYMKAQLILSINEQSHIPFVVPGGEIAASFCVTTLVKALFNDDNLIKAPHGLYIDSYLNNISIYKCSDPSRKFDLAA